MCEQRVFFSRTPPYKHINLFFFILDSSAKLNRNPNSVPENIGDILTDSASSAKVFLVFVFFNQDYLQYFIKVHRSKWEVNQLETR